MRKLLELTDVVEIETLEKIQDDFSEATGFAAITVDYRGKPLTKHSGCTKYCSIMRHRDDTRDLCEKCDSKAGLQAARTEEPFIYMCHSGFVDFAAPIIVDGQYLGSIMGGQVVSSEKPSHVEYVIDELLDIDEDVELIEAYTQIPIVPMKKIMAAAHLMYNIANKIAQQGYVNVMQQELHDQSLQLIQSKTSKANLEVALKAVEQKTLQSLVNRQFLIQTLNTVGNLAYLERAPRTEEAVFALIDVVKYYVSNSGKDVPVCQEIEFVNNYFCLQKIRLGERFSYELLVEEEVKNMKIPSMIVQPIVENAIVHGLETKPGKINVLVSINLVDRSLVIRVVDNGVGIRKQKIDRILQLCDDTINTEMNLKVLKQSLYDRYGTQAEVTMDSREGKGTAVTIRLPVVSFKWGEVNV